MFGYLTMIDPGGFTEPPLLYISCITIAVNSEE